MPGKSWLDLVLPNDHPAVREAAEKFTKKEVVKAGGKGCQLFPTPTAAKKM